MDSPAPKRTYDMSSRAAAAAQTRERILEAAFALWRDHAYDDVSVKQIAQRAGVSLATVVTHFREKEALLEALVEWHRPRESGMREVPSGDLLEAARILCRRYDELGPSTLRLLAIEERVPAAHRILEEGRNQHRAWVERTFGAQLPADVEPRELALAALTAAYDLGTWHVLRRTLRPDACAEAMALLARGALASLPTGARK